MCFCGSRLSLVKRTNEGSFYFSVLTGRNTRQNITVS